MAELEIDVFDPVELNLLQYAHETNVGLVCVVLRIVQGDGQRPDILPQMGVVLHSSPPFLSVPEFETEELAGMRWEVGSIYEVKHVV